MNADSMTQAEIRVRYSEAVLEGRFAAAEFLRGSIVGPFTIAPPGDCRDSFSVRGEIDCEGE